MTEEQLPMPLPTVGDTVPEIVRFLTITKSVTGAIKKAEAPARQRLRELIEDAEGALGLDAFTAKTPYGTAAITNPTENLTITDPEAFHNWCMEHPSRLGPWLPQEVERVRVNPNEDDDILLHSLQVVRGEACDSCPYGVEDHDVLLLDALQVSKGYLLPSEEDVNLLTGADEFLFGVAGSPCRWLDKTTGEFVDIDGTKTKVAARQLRVVITKDAEAEMLNSIMIRTKEIE